MTKKVIKGRSYDKEYINQLEWLKEKGVWDKNPRTVYEDGNKAYSKRGFDHTILINKGTIPVMFSKRLYFKDAVKELLWIWQQRSNKVSDLQEMGCHVWDNWTLPPKYYLNGRNIVLIDRKIDPEMYGEPTVNGVLNDKTEENLKLKAHWSRMIARVYYQEEKRRYYRDKGVQVHPEWWDVNTFVEDVKKIPNYKFKKDDWEEYVLDKDYYGGNIYSKETCVWLPQLENVMYGSSVKPIIVEDDKGKRVTYMCIREIVETKGIPRATVHRFIKTEGKLKNLNRENRDYNGWEFTNMEVPKDKVARLEFIEGTIGKAYGFQLAREVDDTGMNQVDNLIHKLKTDRDSRRHIVTLWDIDSGHEMALKPCVYQTQWVVLENELYLKVISRSTDTSLGEPYNIFQYWVLLQLIAHETGLEPGGLAFSMAIPHYYDRHETEIERQIEYYNKNKDRIDNEEVVVGIDLSKGFYGFTADDIKIKDYAQRDDIPKRKFEIAI